MSAYAFDFGPSVQPRRPMEAPAAPASTVAAVYAAGDYAPPADTKRPRYVQAIFTFLSPRRQPLTIGPCLPQSALARVLDELERHPRKVSIGCNPATPAEIEIRDESSREAPRHLLAIIHEGLSLEEARTALVALQSNPKR